MKRFTICLSLLAAILFIGSAIFRFNRPATAKIYPNEQIVIQGQTRSYRLVVPHSLPNRAPVIFAFHGIGDSTESMARYSQLDNFAEQQGVILVYLSAQKSMWHTMQIDVDNLGENPDVQFFDGLLEHLSDRLPVDHQRIYLMGMSNGATFAQLLAFARSQKIAAVVAHSGTKPRELSNCINPFPILLIAGEEDFAATALKTDAENYRSAAHKVNYISVPNLAHAWSVPHNPQMWSFLSQYTSH